MTAGEDDAMNEKIHHLLKVCKTRLRRDPNDLDALFALGVALAKMKKFQESIRQLDRVTMMNSSYPGIWRLKARIYREMGDHKMAEICNQRSVKVPY